MIRRAELPLFLTGFLATLCGVGLARFAYSALMPQMVLAGWFTAEQVAYLGAANLLGYLIGALLAAPSAQRWEAIPLMGLCWAVIALSFIRCSFPQGFILFFIWRLLSGVAGAALMVLGPSCAMSAAPLPRRTTLGPLMFCGIGVGALLAATLVPLLALQSLPAVWIGLSAICNAAGWWGWRSTRALPAPVPQKISLPQPDTKLRSTLWTTPVILIILAYGLDALGFVPHTVFWVDYLARELQLGSSYASSQWAAFGLGAVAGPLCAAACANRWGWWRCCLGAYALKAFAIGLPVWSTNAFSHTFSGLMVGALTPGLAAITSGFLIQLLSPQQHRKAWGYATALFALLQAVSGYGMAYLYTLTGSYQYLFEIGFAALLLGTLLVILARPQSSIPLIV